MKKKSKEYMTANYGVISPYEVARLLQIDMATVKLWSSLGLLHAHISPGKGRYFILSEVLTFMPEESGVRHFLRGMENESAEDSKLRNERKKLAEVTVQAITELTKQSLVKMSHFGSNPLERT